MDNTLDNNILPLKFLQLTIYTKICEVYYYLCCYENENLRSTQILQIWTHMYILYINFTIVSADICTHIYVLCMMCNGQWWKALIMQYKILWCIIFSNEKWITSLRVISIHANASSLIKAHNYSMQCNSNNRSKGLKLDHVSSNQAWTPISLLTCYWKFVPKNLLWRNNLI